MLAASGRRAIRALVAITSVSIPSVASGRSSASISAASLDAAAPSRSGVGAGARQRPLRQAAATDTWRRSMTAISSSTLNAETEQDRLVAHPGAGRGASHGSGRPRHSGAPAPDTPSIHALSGASRCSLLNSTTAPPGSIIASSRRSVSARSIQWNDRPIVTRWNRPSAGDRSNELPRTKLMRPAPPNSASAMRSISGSGSMAITSPRQRREGAGQHARPAAQVQHPVIRARPVKPRHMTDQPGRIGRPPGQIMLRRGAKATGLEKFDLRHDLFTSRPQCATIWCQGRRIERTEPGHDRTPEGHLDEADHRPGRRRPEHPDQRPDDAGAGGFPGPHLHRRRERPAGPERPAGRSRGARHQDAADGRHGAAAAAAPAQLDAGDLPHLARTRRWTS